MRCRRCGGPHPGATRATSYNLTAHLGTSCSWQVLDRSFAHVTEIVVAHKLRTIEDADQILVMRDGELVDSGARSREIAAQSAPRARIRHEPNSVHVSGTHAALLCSKDGTYREMWQQQTLGPAEAAKVPRRGCHPRPLPASHNSTASVLSLFTPPSAHSSRRRTSPTTVNWSTASFSRRRLRRRACGQGRRSCPTTHGCGDDYAYIIGHACASSMLVCTGMNHKVIVLLRAEPTIVRNKPFANRRKVPTRH